MGFWVLGITLVVSLLLLAALVYGIVAFIGRMRRDAQEPLTLKVVPISEARSGQVVKIVGTVSSAGKTVTNPLTGEQCLSCEAYVAVEMVYKGAPKDNWNQLPLAQSKRHAELWVSDGTGVAQVSGKLEVVGFESDVALSDPRVDAFIRECGVKRPEKSRLRAFGRVVEEGAKVVVVGKVREQSAEQGKKGGAYRAEQTMIGPRPNGTVWVADETAGFPEKKPL